MKHSQYPRLLCLSLTMFLALLLVEQTLEAQIVGGQIVLAPGEDFVDAATTSQPTVLVASLHEVSMDFNDGSSPIKLQALGAFAKTITGRVATSGKVSLFNGKIMPRVYEQARCFRYQTTSPTNNWEDKSS
jgi:hypothetical protein